MQGVWRRKSRRLFNIEIRIIVLLMLPRTLTGIDNAVSIDNNGNAENEKLLLPPLGDSDFCMVDTERMKVRVMVLP